MSALRSPLQPPPLTPRENAARIAEDDGVLRGQHPTPAHAELAKLIEREHQQIGRSKRRYEGLVAAQAALIAAYSA